MADLAMRQTIMGTAIGNFMEWYDFWVYGYIATTIAPRASVPKRSRTQALRPTANERLIRD